MSHLLFSIIKLFEMKEVADEIFHRHAILEKFKLSRKNSLSVSERS